MITTLWKMENINLTNVDFKTICRTCLLQNGTTSIFSGNNSIQSMLIIVCNIQALEFDGFPTSLCSDCIKKITAAFSFREQCEKTKIILKDYVDKFGSPLLKKEEYVENIQEDISSTKTNHSINNELIDVKDYYSDSNSETNTIAEKHKKVKHKQQKEEIGLRRRKSVYKRKTKDKVIHVETLMENGKNVYQCILCESLYDSQNELIKHYKTHDRERPYICSQCGKGFKRPSNLNDHILRHRGAKPYRCDVCSKEYAFKDSLNIHIRNHTGERPYPCSDCDKAFSHLSQLRQHQRSHTKEKPYMCPYCGVCMSMITSLKVHIRIHTGERPYKCTECDKAFAQGNKLKRHMTVHTGEKNFVCSICNKAFGRKSHLTVHEMIHTNKRPHICSICGRGFIQAHVLRNHLNTHVNT